LFCLKVLLIWSAWHGDVGFGTGILVGLSSHFRSNQVWPENCNMRPITIQTPGQLWMKEKKAADPKVWIRARIAQLRREISNLEQKL
jgi:hypothetical protein